MPDQRYRQRLRRERAAGLAAIARGIRLAVFDFDGVFTDNRVIVFQDGREAVTCSRADGFGLSRLRNAGCALLVISLETNPVVEARCRKLGLEVVHSCEDKVGALRARADQLGLDLSEVAYLGNDINDLPCLAIVGLPACVSDAYPEVKKVSAFQTRALGGYGAVRELCDFLADARGAARIALSPSKRRVRL